MAIPKNSDLFGGLNGFEECVFKPDEYPWDALRRMGEQFERFRRGADPWPAPCFDAVAPQDGSTRGSIESFGRRSIRGGEGLKSDAHCVIMGPVILGKGVVIRHSAVVTGPCIIGNGVVIGHGCRVKNAILRDGAKLEYTVRVSNTIVGAGTYIGTNATLDDEPFNVSDGLELPVNGALDHEVVRTGMRRMGPIFGDQCRILGGVILVPGVILMPKAQVQAGTRIRRPGCHGGRLMLDIP